MDPKSMKRPLAAAAIVALLVGGVGCELVADFDRTKIDAGSSSTDAGLRDQTAPPVDTGTDAPADAVGDAPGNDGQVPGPDASDGGTDAAPDGDAGTVSEAGPDAGPDAADARADAADAGPSTPDAADAEPAVDASEPDADDAGPDALQIDAAEPVDGAAIDAGADVEVLDADIDAELG
jgi:hypothetical protein